MTQSEALKVWLPVVAMGVENMPECKEALEMAIKAEEQIIRITELLNDLSLDDVSREKYEKKIMKQSLNDIIDELWEFYCFAEDVCNTLNL